jgi:hypothetical protein
MMKVAWKIAGTLAAMSFAVSRHAGSPYALTSTPPGNKPRAYASTSLPSSARIFGESELVEELRFVELEPEVLRAKEEVQKGRFGNRLLAHIGDVRIAQTQVFL